MINKANWFSVVVLLSTLTFLMTGCNDDYSDYDNFDVYEQYQVDSTIIDAYVEEYDLDAYKIGTSGVYISFSHYGLLSDSLGQPTRDTDTSTTVQYVTVGYKGYYVDGSVFDSSEESTFALSSVIYGWQLAIPEMSIGDSATILLPSYWGYGHYGVGSIPGDAVLLFDVYLASHERL